jgi:uncharacterized protein
MITTFTEEPASWLVDEIEVHATLARPAGDGPFPAVIFVAGSGPTDRDWNSPAIPGSNGSGGLLAHALAQQGFITLRYDKRASGPHVMENLPRMAGKISMQAHTEEVAGGVRLLAGRADVAPGRIFTLTNSEGCVHALNYQADGHQPPFAGLLLTSAFARPTGELAHSQIAAQLQALPGGDVLLAAYEAAMRDFTAGRAVTVDESLPPSLGQVIKGITQPINQPFARELWVFNPLEKLAHVSAPVLVLIGKKDIQVDWLTDGPLFEAVAQAHPNLRVQYLEDANHVLKLEPRPRAELTAAQVMATYSAADVPLDPQAVAAILAWLRTQNPS